MIDFTLSILQKWKRMQIAFSFVHGITLVLQHYFTERLSFVDILDDLYILNTCVYWFE